MALDVIKLLDGLHFHLQGAPLPPRVGEVRAHSAQVEPGDLFVAIPGRRHDGAAFVGEAVRRGARIVVAQRGPAGPPPPGVTWLQVPCARAALSRLAANRYGHPSRRLAVVGVTGTNGKTTTTLLLHHLLTAAGVPAGLIGSLEVRTGLRRWPGDLTTPDPLHLHRYLREMVDAGCRVAVMEVSSQGVDQGRVDDVAFDLGVVTNLAPLEHLEYHPTYEHYAAAKGRFVAMVPPGGGVLMHEGEAALRLGPYARAPVVLFGRGPECPLRLAGEHLDELAPLWTNRLHLQVPLDWPAGPNTPVQDAWLGTQLLGPHHAMNVVAAVGAARWLGLGLDVVAAALPAFPAPRRRTQVLMRHPITVIDDTAGRPDSLAACFTVAARIPHRRMAAVYAVRGGRGEAINYANGLQLAREARRFGAALVVTASAGDTSPRDTVRPAEWEACLAGIAAGGLEPPQVTAFARLGDAVAAAVARLAAGDLLLLLGAQGMDAGAAYLRAILAGEGEAARAVAGADRGGRAGATGVATVAATAAGGSPVPVSAWSGGPAATEQPGTLELPAAPGIPGSHGPRGPKGVAAGLFPGPPQEPLPRPDSAPRPASEGVVPGRVPVAGRSGPTP